MIYVRGNDGRPVLQPRGLGDVLSTKIQKATGKKPCKGCRKIRDAVNKVVPFRNA
jgi:hypothetical protein